MKPAVDLTKMQNVPGGPRIIKEAFGGDVPFDRNPVNTVDQRASRARRRLADALAARPDLLAELRKPHPRAY